MSWLVHVACAIAALMVALGNVSVLAADAPTGEPLYLCGIPYPYDAALKGNPTSTVENTQFIFRGSQFWQYRGDLRRITLSMPQSISSGFPGVPNDLDAAVAYTSNSKFYFFKGTQYWRYSSSVGVDAGYPKTIDFGFNSELPNYIDAIERWSGDLIYVYKGSLMYEFHEVTWVRRVEESHDRRLLTWKLR